MNICALVNRYEDCDPVVVPVKHIRPRARHNLTLDELKVGDRVMVNYNYDEPTSRGYWYDAVVDRLRSTRTIKELFVTAYIGYVVDQCYVHAADISRFDWMMNSGFHVID